MMRVDIASTSILLVILLSAIPSMVSGSTTTGADDTTLKPTDPPATVGETTTEAITEAATSKATDPPPPPPTTVPPTVPPTTTTTPIETTTPNPNITLIPDVQRNAFIRNCNLLREKHQMGRFAYVWTWDDTLVDSAIARITPSCELKIDDSDNIHELLLDADEWKKVRRDKNSFIEKIRSIIYQKGAARVGCVERKGCGGGVDKDKVYFCHFGPSNFTTEPDFEKPAENCIYDETYSALCIDAPPPEETTPVPVIYKYVKYSMRIDVMMIIGMVLAGIISTTN